MCAWIVPPIQGLIEAVPAPEILMEGIGAVEICGALVRVYGFVEQLPLEAGNLEIQRLVTVKILRPIADIPDAIGRMAQALRERSPDIQKGPWPRVVK